MANTPEYLYRTDSESYTGIQFWVDWLRTDTLCTIYTDYAEVYDYNGWRRYLANPQEVEDSIIAYTHKAFPSGIT